MRVQGQAGVDGRHFAGQRVEIILVGIVFAHVQDKDDILVLVPSVPAETDDAHLLHAGKGGEGIFQIVRIDVFAGLIDDDVLQAPLDEDAAAVIHLGHIAGGEPASVLRVGREHLSLHHTAGMDAGAADLQLAGFGAVLTLDPVLSGSQG